MKSCIARALAGGLLLTLASCGYKLGGVQPSEMDGVERLYISIPDNRTQFPRLEAHLANHLVDSLIEDSRYKVSTFENADAKLVTKIDKVTFKQIRSDRTDSLRPEELRMKVLVKWEVISLKGSEREVLLKGSESGDTRFFLDENLQTAQRNAFPDALNRVSRRIISSLSNAL